MSSSTPTVEPTHVPAPVIRANRSYCPRCDAVLQFNRDEYMCFACGYEYLLDDREIDLLREGRQPFRRAAAIGALPLTAGIMTGSAVVVTGLIAVGLGAVLVARSFRRRFASPPGAT